jgi:hypothetical protein
LVKRPGQVVPRTARSACEIPWKLHPGGDTVRTMDTPGGRSTTFERFGGLVAIAAAAAGLGYTATFVAVVRGKGGDAALVASQIFLLVGGLLACVVAVALYGRLRETDAGFALLALFLGLAGGLGAAIHGAFDLATYLEPPSRGRGALPHAVDPRGFLTFGLTALALLTVSWLILRGGQFPRGLGYVAALGGVLLVIVYLGRLIVVDPETWFLKVAAVISGFLVSPAFYLWVGVELMRTSREVRPAG